MNKLGKILLLALAYYVTGRLGLTLDAVSGSATLVWPPTGISLVALLLGGIELWPGVFLGALTANYLTGAPPLMATGIAIGNTLEAIAGVWLLQQMAFDRQLQRLRDVATLAICGSVISTMLSASIGVASLWLAGRVDAATIPRTWCAWWVGDGMSDIVIAPLLLVWLVPWRQLKDSGQVKWELSRLFEGALLIFATLWVGFEVFDLGFFGASVITLRLLPYTLFPMSMWSSFRFGPRGAVTISFLIAAIAIYATAIGHGPFIGASLNERLLMLQTFLAVASITSMVLAASLAERRLSEAQWIAAKERAESASHAKSTFLANMSHEIRTPLAAILGFSDLLVNREAAPEDVPEFAQAVRRNGELLSKLVDDILDLSRVEAGKLDVAKRTVDLEELLADIVLLFDRSDARFSIARGANLPRAIETDPFRLRQILTNLINNALKFSGREHVLLSISAQNNAHEQTVLRFAVQDKGLGIKTEFQKNLFQAFSQGEPSISRTYGGTGLGLALSRHLARALGGDLWLAESKIGEGSTFICEIRGEIRDETARSKIAPAEPLPKTLHGVNILVADDAPDNRILVEHMLSRVGAQVHTVSNGEDAVKRALTGTYDVVLMDLQMPQKNGYEATADLRRAGFNKPIVALTAHTLSGEKEKCMQLGFDDHCKKPIERQTLIASLSRLARTGRPGLEVH